MPTPEELAYGESVRAIEMQARSVDELRSRTGVLLAAASIVASLLGAEALQSSGLQALTVLALIAFTAALALSLGVLWPRGDWRFALGAQVLLEDWTGPTPSGDSAVMLAFLATQLETNWKANKGRIDDMLRLFRWAVGALGVQVILSILQLAEGR